MIKYGLTLSLIVIFLCCDTVDNESYVPTSISYSTLLCLNYVNVGVRNHIISSESAYDSVIGNAACGDSVIDFTLYTLLGQNGTASGCREPFYQITVLRDDLKKEIVYKLMIIEHGNCQPAFLRYLWILVPKVPESYRVVFQKEITNDDLIYY